MAGEDGMKEKEKRKKKPILTRAAGCTLWALVVGRAGGCCCEGGGRAHKQGNAEWEGA